MKETKRCMVMFSFYDHTGIEAFLEKQAANGWMLDKISAFGWRFRRMEPLQVHFSVVYFSKASAFDPEPSEQQLMFQDFCEHTGWCLAASSAQMQIFYNESDNPTPIETDAVLEISAIHTSAIKSYLISLYLLVGVGVLQASLFIWRLFSDPLAVIGNNLNLFSGLCWMLMLLISLGEIVSYHSWHRRAKAAAKLDGTFIETKRTYNFQVVILGIMFVAFAFLLLSYGGNKVVGITLASFAVILGITAFVLGISTLMKKWKFSAKLNRNITIILTIVISIGVTQFLLISIVSNMSFRGSEHNLADTYSFKGMSFRIYHDELPLTIEDLIETDYDGYSYENYNRNKSIFIEQQDITQRPRMDNLNEPRLEYMITTVKIPLLYEWCKSVLLDDFDHNYGHSEENYEMWKSQVQIDAAPWGANEAYQLKLGDELQMRFLLCYDDRMVEIDFENDWELTVKQMEIVGEKLGA